MAVTLTATLTIPLTGCGGDSSSDTPAVTATELRTTTPLMQGWKFIQDDMLTDDAAVAADGTSWSGVTLPHTWNAADAASTNATAPYKRGRGWYRLEFTGTNLGATNWLEFGAASIVADVWLNGQKLGTHAGAFGAFRFDVTGKLNAGKNVLLVKTDNSDTTQTANWVAPTSGDFNMSGGLYRGVSLISTPYTAHFALDDMGSSGIYANTVSITSGTATINVQAKLKNDSKTDSSYIVQATLLDAAGNVAKSNQNTVIAKAGTPVESTQALTISGAHLWQGINDPYLYKLVVELKNSTGTTLDKVVQDFGIRQMFFDPNKGFFLNGKLTTLHGVNLHQDALGKGWAISTSDIDQSLALIKEMGANAVRLAHYQHAPYTYALADKLGLIVWAENGFVGGVNASPSCDANAADPSAYFVDNIKQQTQEMVRQNYNHASIAMWGIGNEVTQVQTNSSRCGPGKDNVTALLRTLNALTKQEDSTRVTTLANISEDVPGSTFIADGGITDIWGLNRYNLWYGGDALGLSNNLDLLHAKYPNQPVGMSEYGSGSALGDQTDNPLGGPVGSMNTGQSRVYQPEGYSNYQHENIYPVIAGKNYLWGSFLWTMFDFGSGIRNEGDTKGVNTKGLVSYDRQTKKDTFFYYKANWSKDPVTYITGRRYTQRAYPVADVTVYSNADTVKFSVNGNIIATMPQSQCVMKSCAFKNIPLSTGANSLVATGSFIGKNDVIDTVNWTLSSDNSTNIYIAAGQLATGLMSSTGHRYGSDNFFTGGAGTKDIPAKGVSGADIQLYSTIRSSTSNFSYNIPVANGNYNVTLGFLEPTTTAVIGTNIFNVSANGVIQLSNLDVAATAGANRTVITRTFPVTVTSGMLKLDFTPTAGKAMVSNISIIKR